jgi:hypothetical protein
MRIRHKVPKDHKPVSKSPRDDLDEDEQVLHDAYSKYDDSQLFNLIIYFDSGLKIEYKNQTKEAVLQMLLSKMKNCNSRLTNKEAGDGGGIIDFSKVECIDVTVVGSDKE